MYESAAIVLVQFVGETEEKFKILSDTGEDGGLARIDVFRTYKVAEVLKGEVKEGSELVVWYSRALEDTMAGYTISSEMPPATKGHMYALFLMRAEREDGKTYWGQIGVPGFAEVSGQSLKFETTSQYREEMIARGLTLQPDSGAPFSLSVPQLRELALKNEPPPPQPTPTASGGTPFPTKEAPADSSR